MRFAIAIGVVAWLACAAVDATFVASLDELLTLRLARRWAEHPVRVIAAGTLAAWALAALIRGTPPAPPSEPSE